jgi:hypothetical protein
MRDVVPKSLLIPVWIRTPSSPLYQCALTSASEYWGELMVDDPFAPPDRFDLLFSPIAQSWRECSIIARRYGAKSIKIRFLARHLPLYRGQHGVQGLQIPSDQIRQRRSNHPRTAGTLARGSGMEKRRSSDEVIE